MITAIDLVRQLAAASRAADLYAPAHPLLKNAVAAFAAGCTDWMAERPSVGRIGSTILHALGHPEWIAATEEEYIDKAVALATDIDGLAQLRAGLRAQMLRAATMDEPAFARSVESAYREMWRRWCEGCNVETLEIG